MLVGLGFGAAYIMFGGAQSDPSEEIEQIIERKMEEVEAEKQAQEEASKGESKVVKETPEVETFMTTYFEFQEHLPRICSIRGDFCRLALESQPSMMIL